MENKDTIKITKMSDYDKEQILKEMKITDPFYDNPTYYNDILTRHIRLSKHIKKNYTQWNLNFSFFLYVYIFLNSSVSNRWELNCG